ncbi:type II-A CRISPR-associated protein Csn2 [Brochothrix thermosphacta]|uniref:type II-A CRISPR-associated protein Csn2 n=1 Tax=Brochothrix thermosphacta TaxID=2756 RepID=UPI0009C01D34
MIIIRKSILLELRQLIGIQLNDYDLPLQLNEEVKLSSLYKLFNVTIEVETESILDRLLLLIDLVAQLKIARIIILNNVRCYFVEQELLEVYKYALYKNIKLLLIEPIFKKGKLQYERKLQIDNDYIEFWQ